MNYFCSRQSITIIYKKQRQVIIQFIWGILVGIALTTLVFQQHLLLSSTESWLSAQIDVSYNLFQPTFYNLDRRKINDIKLLLKSKSDHNQMKIENQERSISNRAISHVKNRIYVGVITAEKYLGSRSTGVNNTWGQQVDKIEFFAQFGSREKYEIPVVNLENASDREYPPQKKAFEMLKYMCFHHVDDYEWFIRADDDVYIRVEKLRKFLSGVDSNKAIYMGQPGHGLPEVRMRLGLRGHNFCMGGPGVIFSRKAMKSLCPHIDNCMKEVVSNEEDVEIGRCVTNHLQIECTHAWESVNLFYHAYQEEYDEDQPFLGNLFDNKHVNPSLTLHYLKQPRIMHQVHRHFTALALRSTEQNLLELQDDLNELDEKLPTFRRRDLFFRNEIFSTIRARRLKQAVSWKTFTTKNLYSNDLTHVKRDITNDVHADLKQVAESAIDTSHNISLFDSFVFSHVMDGSLRSDFSRGTDYHVDIMFNDRKSLEQTQIRRVRLLRPSASLRLSRMRKASLREDESLFVVIVLVEQSKTNQLEIFMRNFYEPLFLAEGQSRTARLIVAATCPSPILQTWSLNPSIDDVLKVYRDRYPSAVLVSLPPEIPVSPLTVEWAYAHGVVRAHVLTKSFDPKKVHILLTSANVTLSSDAARRCRLRGSASDKLVEFDHVQSRQRPRLAQLYQPIPFQVYSSARVGPWATAVLPQATGLKPGTGVASVALLKPEIGFWRQDKVHPLICGCLADLYPAAVASIEKPVEKGGFFALLDNLGRNQNLTIFRAPDRSYSVLPTR